jgi:hypothetical protein
MKKVRLIAALVSLYPASWRARYGDEFAALLEQTPLTPPVVLDVLRTAWGEHWNHLLSAAASAFGRWQRQTIVLLNILALLYLPAPRPGRRPVRESLAPPLTPRFLFP